MTRNVVYSPRARGQLVADFPLIGLAKDDPRPGLRTVGFRRRAVIAFAVHESAVEIHGVYYGGRDYEALIPAEND